MLYKPGEVYAVETGDYVGQMFVVVSKHEAHINCLSLPHMENIEVPKEAFDRGRNNDIITLIEKLPKAIFKVVKAQYKKNEDSNNRWEQSNPSNILDSKKPS